MLEQIDSTEDLKKLTVKQLPQLCKEIRDFLIPAVIHSGGHLASNLGIVELTVALHYVFDDTDKIVWDVGHQSYIHKILTGRRDLFDSLRSQGGISGFPDTDESPLDAFGTGHASTAISAALGIATARDIKKEDYNVIAVVGDGALTGGLSFEGLNNVNGRKMLIIVNDNQMSINDSIGTLSKLRVGAYERRQVKFATKMQKNGFGRLILKGFNFIKRLLKYGFIDNNLYLNSFNAKYLGVIDGNDVGELVYYLKQIKKNVNRTAILHICTVKGKGYDKAENAPEKFHGLSNPLETDKMQTSMSKIVGQTLCNMAAVDQKIVAICAAMKDGVGLSEYADKYPERFFDCGIAEEHCATFAAGLASQGLKPYVCIYSTFMQRAFDQVLHDCCTQNLPVVFCIDRAGFCGNDGKTHQGLFDISYLTCIPNLTVLSPADDTQLVDMLKYAQTALGPVAIRYPKQIDYPLGLRFDKLMWNRVYDKNAKIEIIASGNRTLVSALKLAESFCKQSIDVNVTNACTLKPIDEPYLRTFTNHTHVITLEENVLIGGLGASIAQFFADTQVKVYNFGVKDKYVKHATIRQQIADNRLDFDSLYADISKIVL